MTGAGPTDDFRRNWAFDTAAAQARWPGQWQAEELFTPEPHSGRPRFAMVLPPPSLNAVMHLGHALQISVQDVLARYRRMAGYEVLWLPGTDHAAISTQRAVEQHLARRGQSREEIGRDAFRVVTEQWFESMAGQILDQAVAIGASVDLTRQRFTMDADYQRAVRTAFVHFWETGYIVRAPRIINFCPSCRAVLSDMEVRSGEERPPGYRLRCTLVGELSATTVEAALRRPEHALACAAVGVGRAHPGFASLVGAQVEVPPMRRTVPVVEYPEAGDDVVMIVPAHDATHLDFATRAGLGVKMVVGLDYRVSCPELPQFDRQPAPTVAKALADQLISAGVLRAETAAGPAVDGCARCGSTLDRFATDQWFVRMTELSAPALAAAQGGEPHWCTPGQEQRYLDWLTEQRDWCISRQLWLGHRIPVYTCDKGHEFAIVDEPKRCVHCGSGQLDQDPDVLDTWFSSALWPFATLGWPKSTPELDAFFPLDMWISSREVIGLALVRTVAASLELTGRVPFRDIVITGLVQSVDGVKMSTAKGNSVAPEYVIGRYGADALRTWAAEVALTGRDVRFDEARILRFRRMINTLWERSQVVFEGRCTTRAERSLADRWILTRIGEVTQAVTGAIERYEFHRAVRELDDFVSNDLSGLYLLPSLTGAVPAASADTARKVLDRTLRLLHPFMPFFTEEMWDRLGGRPRLVAGAAWPVEEVGVADSEACRQLETVRIVLKELRRMCTDFGLAPTTGGEMHLELPLDDEAGLLLAELAGVRLVSEPLPGAIALSGWPAFIRFDVELPDSDARRSERLRLRKQRARLRARVADEAFLAKAPRDVVSRLRSSLADVEAALARIDGDEGPMRDHSSA